MTLSGLGRKAGGSAQWESQTTTILTKPVKVSNLYGALVGVPGRLYSAVPHAGWLSWNAGWASGAVVRILMAEDNLVN